MKRKRPSYPIVIEQLIYIALWVVNNKNYLPLAIFLFLLVGFARGPAARDFIVRDTCAKIWTSRNDSPQLTSAQAMKRLKLKSFKGRTDKDIVHGFCTRYMGTHF